MIALLLTAAFAAGETTLPPSPAPSPRPGRDVAPTPDEPPAFGNDVSVGYHLARLSGPWMQGGVSGVVSGRYDAFARSRGAAGTRLGVSFWGSTNIGPSQQGMDAGGTETVPADFIQAGILGIMRQDPAAPIGLDAGLGFGRLELDGYYGGPLVLPTLTFEAGGRFAAGERSYADLLARAHWATARSGAVPDALEEWWMVGLGVEIGTHLR